MPEKKQKKQKEQKQPAGHFKPLSFIKINRLDETNAVVNIDEDDQSQTATSQHTQSQLASPTDSRPAGTKSAPLQSPLTSPVPEELKPKMGSKKQQQMLQSIIKKVGNEQSPAQAVNPFSSRFKFQFKNEFDLFKPQAKRVPKYKSFADL